MSSTRIEFAVICDSHFLEVWQVLCLERVLALPHADLLLVIRDTSPARPRGGNRLWNAYVDRYAHARSSARRRRDASDLLANVPVAPCSLIDPPQPDLEAIRAAGLDFILHFGRNSGGSALGGCARYGVWALRSDEVERCFGVPPCLWPILRRNPLNEASLVRLSSRGGAIELQSGTLKTINYSYARALDATYFATLDWPAKVCADIRNGVAHYLDGPTVPLKGPEETRPGTIETVAFLMLLGTNLLRALYSFLLRHDQWNVGLVDAPIESFLSDGARPPIRWLPRRPIGNFIADPMAVSSENGLTLLVEEFDPDVRRGHITGMHVSTRGEIEQARVAMREPYHMAYPYIVQHEGEIYSIPDTSSTREVALYHAVCFPHRWERVATLLSGIAASDSTIFRHDNRWWLFCTRRESGIVGLATRESGAHTTLFAWHADELYGPWIPHAANPLKIDIRSSRPAGTPFVHEGELFRPAQDCTSTYGGAIALNRVTRLTPTQFSEEVAKIVCPFPESEYPDGIHTICGAGPITVIDGKREMFMPSQLWAKIRHVANRVPLLAGVKGR